MTDDAVDMLTRNWAYAVVVGIPLSMLALRLRSWGKAHRGTMSARPA